MVLLSMGTLSFEEGEETDFDSGDGKKKRSRKRYPNMKVVLNAATQRMYEIFTCINKNSK